MPLTVFCVRVQNQWKWNIPYLPLPRAKFFLKIPNKVVEKVSPRLDQRLYPVEYAIIWVM